MPALMKFEFVFTHKATEGDHGRWVAGRTIVVHATEARLAEAMCWLTLGPRRFWHIVVARVIK